MKTKGPESRLKTIVFAPIGEEQQGKLSLLAEEHAKTKRAIIKEVIDTSKSKKVAVLFNYNHGPSSKAATIMAGDLVNVELKGEYSSDLSNRGNFDKQIIINLMKKHEQMDMLVIVGTVPVCYQIPNQYAQEKGLEQFKMKILGPDEVYKMDLRQNVLDILQCVPSEIEAN
jgi:hypothetical protein